MPKQPDHQNIVLGIQSHYIYIYIYIYISIYKYIHVLIYISTTFDRTQQHVAPVTQATQTPVKYKYSHISRHIYILQVWIYTYTVMPYTKYHIPVIPAQRRTLPSSLELISVMRSCALTIIPSAAAAALRELQSKY